MKSVYDNELFFLSQLEGFLFFFVYLFHTLLNLCYRLVKPFLEFIT